MLFQKKLSENKLKISLLLFLIFVCASYLVYLQKTKKIDYQSYSQSFQKTLHAKESLLDKYLNQICSEFLTKKKASSNNILSAYNNLYEEEGFCFFLYDNDSMALLNKYRDCFLLRSSQFAMTLNSNVIARAFCPKQSINLYQINNTDSIIGWSTNAVAFDNNLKKSVYKKKIVQLKNGWFELKGITSNKICVLGLICIKNNYKYDNDYFENKFQQDFDIPKETTISEQNGKYNIITGSGNFLCSLSFSDTTKSTNDFSYLILVLFIASVFLLIHLIFSLFDKISKKINKNFICVLAIFSVLLIRILSFYFSFPAYIYSLVFFSPKYYATSEMLPSLGDLLLNAIFVFSVCVYFFKKTRYFKSDNKTFSLVKIIIVFLLIFLSVLAFHFALLLLSSIIINSNMVLNLNNIFGLSIQSITGSLIITFFLFSFILLASRLMQISFILLKNVFVYFIFFTIILFIYGIILHFYFDFCFFYLIILFVFFTGIAYYQSKTGVVLTISSMIFYIIILSLITTFSLYKYDDFKEKEKRKLTAIKLSSERDPIAEYLFVDMEHHIKADDTIKKYLKYLPASENNIVTRLQHNYFNGYWSKYDCQITICKENDSLIIKPDNFKTVCDIFFNRIINNVGAPTLCENFFYLNKEAGRNSYLAVFKYSDFILPTTIYVELDSKFIPKELGYPELLIDKKTNTYKDISNYSYAKYRNNELIMQYGKYFYNINSKFYEQYKDEFSFFNMNGYNHLLYKSNNATSVIVSKKQANLLDIIAPLSYFFVFFLIVFFIAALIIYFPINVKNVCLTFKSRLQIAMISIILFSFIFIGIITVYYIISIYHNKNASNVSEKAHSVLIEMENKLSNVEQITPEMTDYISELLVKFSNVFFTDINLYDLSGSIISSSRYKIFDEGLVSKKMDPIAFNQLAVDEKNLFINNENIGNLNYISVYIPFRNNQNKVIAYLNIPYFSKQSELKKELSAFLVAFINIYILLVAIAVILALLMANYITRPLKFIRYKLSHIKLGQLNEKIQWNKKDEIGTLITEYNRMIDELAKSAELLAQSERESAWREMAKQIAHEIKNPLTPMKLSIQHLQKLRKENAPDWELRLNHFLQTMIEQIESLSLIASEFSDFAKISQTKNEKVELIKLIESVIMLHKNFNIQIIFDKPTTEKLFIYVCKTQILRVFNNLLKNSIQAIGEKQNGIIKISISLSDDFYLISIYDNGSGIPPEQIDKIFTPNFTTKTSGMGLGLAMVKSIINGIGGKIWFETQIETNTTFFFTIPRKERENINLT